MEQVVLPPALTRGPFSRRHGLAVTSSDTLRGPAFQQLYRGVYRSAGDLTYVDWILAARQVLPPDAVLAGQSALWAHGVALADPSTPVEVILPPGSRARNRGHLRVRRDRLLQDEAVVLALGPTTSPARTAFDLARAGIPYDVVPLIDALAAATGVTRRQVDAVAAAHPGARWLRRVGPALDLVDRGSESVRESQLRLLVVAGGLPRPVTGFVIRTKEGRFVARADLAWPQYRVILEYDGAYHDEKGQVIRDRARLNAIRQADWTPIVVDAAQFARPETILALVRSVLVAAGWRE